MDDADTVTVTDDPDRGHYVLRVDGHPAGTLVYRPAPGASPARVFVHTGIDPAFEGRGLGSRLIAAALDDARTRGFRVLPQCPFVRAYLGRHPEDLDVVGAADRAAYGLPPA
ncbi:GNAT family N-acetyltransferase [Jatrophihabitans sp. YIM 134969]